MSLDCCVTYVPDRSFCSPVVHSVHDLPYGLRTGDGKMHYDAKQGEQRRYTSKPPCSTTHCSGKPMISLSFSETPVQPSSQRTIEKKFGKKCWCCGND